MDDRGSKMERGRRSHRRRRADPFDRLLSILKSGGDRRDAKIRRIRDAIGAKAYENDLKVSVALDRLLRELRA